MKATKLLGISSRSRFHTKFSEALAQSLAYGRNKIFLLCLLGFKKETGNSSYLWMWGKQYNYVAGTNPNSNVFDRRSATKELTRRQRGSANRNTT